MALKYFWPRKFPIKVRPDICSSYRKMSRDILNPYTDKAKHDTITGILLRMQN